MPSGPLVSPTVPLSSRERDELLTRGSWLPALVVLIALAASITLPRIGVERITAFRNEISANIEPARLLLAKIQLDLALQGTQRRGFLLTGDGGVESEEGLTRSDRVAAEQQLVGLARRLDRSSGSAFTHAVTRLQSLDRNLDSMVATSPDHTGAQLRDQHDRWVTVRTAAATLSTAFDSVARARRDAIQKTVDHIELLTVGLVVLGVGAALLVVRLGRRFRDLALRLDENEARFRQITENLSAVVWLSDHDFRHTFYVNRAYERIWGRPRDTLETNPESAMQGVHPDDRARLRSALADVAHHVADVEFRVVRPDGAIRWVWNRGFPVRDSTGRIVRIAGIIEDVTERREHALERERLLESERTARELSEQRQLELERVTESRGRLVRGFTHDVKNPLSAADGYLALLEEGVLGRVEDSVRGTITKVRGSIRQALELIAQVLDLARAESGQLEIRKRPADLVEVVRGVADAFLARAKTKDIAIVTELQPGVPCIETDAMRVRQVVGNLVSNAVKYTPRGGRIAVGILTTADTVQRRREQIIISVSDNGPGIPTDKLPMLFVEFARLDPGSADGNGIGLAISRRIAQGLGGEITVESKPGAGATFALHLPYVRQPRDGA